MAPLFKYIFYQFSIFDSFFHFLDLGVLELLLWTRLALNSEICLLLPLQCWDSRYVPPHTSTSFSLNPFHKLAA